MLQLPSGPLSLDRTLVMGIVNVTPDSFYDRGRYRTHEAALAHARELAAEGADLLDVGGEKAGPGDPVSVEQEIERVVPVIEAIRREIGLPVSVDTFKSAVAEAAIEAGADIINSIGGFAEPEMRRVAAETGAGAVVMHIKGKPRVAYPNPEYGDVAAEVRDWLRERVALCVADGIKRAQIIIDPGPGFGKTSAQDIALLRGLGNLTGEPYPLLLAVSRKKFIGDVLGTEPDERLEGSLAVTAWGVLRGAKIIRAHDVRATLRVARMTEAVIHPPALPAVPA